METRIAKSILLVEDNDAHAYLIRRYIEHVPSVGHIDRVSDGSQALDYFFGDRPEGTFQARPDLVLLDLHLPRVNGFDVLRKIKLSPDLRSIPVVVLTTSETRNDASTAYELHANGYLIKPIDASMMAEMLTATVRYWLICNQAL